MLNKLSVLPYGRQSIDDDDIAAVVAALKSDHLTTGPAVARFEQEFAAATGAAHAVVVTNGTAALHLSMMAMDIAPGEFVAVPAVTFLASANCARYVGAEVLFTDVDPDTGLMTPATLEAALARLPAGGRLKAVVPVHLTGAAAEIEAIADIAVSHGAGVVEDACHAIGTSYVDRKAQTHKVGACHHSQLANFSLHPVKTITMGEGGVITTADPGVAQRLATLRSHGMVRNPNSWTQRDQGFTLGEPNDWYYEMQELGFNFRATDIQCALGSSQLAKLPRFVARRQEIRSLYDRLLAPLSPLIRPQPLAAPDRTSLHLYVVHVDFDAIGMTRLQLMRSLRAYGILSQVHYLPVNHQPYYRALYGDIPTPGADEYYNKILSIPFYPDMTDADVERVSSALAEIIGR